MFKSLATVNLADLIPLIELQTDRQLDVRPVHSRETDLDNMWKFKDKNGIDYKRVSLG